MCQIILQKPGHENMPESYFKNSYENNRDAIGIAVATGERVLVAKFATADVNDYKLAYKQYLKWRERYPDSPVLIHTRIGTSGKRDETNCHPFVLGNHQAALAHNGVFYETTDRTSDLSDTNILVTKSISPLVERFGEAVVLDPAFKFLCETFVTKTSSKLAFITASGKMALYNEGAGNVEEKYGAWFSNDSHCRVNSFVYAGNKKVSKDFWGGTHYGDGWDDEPYPPANPKKLDAHRPAGNSVVATRKAVSTLVHEGCLNEYKTGDVIELVAARSGNKLRVPLKHVHRNGAIIVHNGEDRVLWYDQETKLLYNSDLDF